jgi:pyroglutamyl-peptidase
MSRNPSAELARRVAASPRWRRLGIAAQPLILPTTYAALADVLGPVLADETADAVLMIGVAGRSKQVRIERRALNRTSILLPDAASRRAAALTLGGGPRARQLRASPVRLRAVLRRHAVPCRISQDVGRYLCNAAYFQALASPFPVLFIHIPKQRPATRPGGSGGLSRRPPRTGALAAALVDVGVALTLRSERMPLPVAGPGGAD